MAYLSLSFFGPFQVRAAGETATNFRSTNSRGLLVYLALQPEQPFSRDVLAALLWSEESDAVARKNVRQALYQLRQVLGDEDGQGQPFFLTTRETIQFNQACDYQLDATAFDRAVSAKDWQKAVALYTDDLLTGFPSESLEFENWLFQERERLRRLALIALYNLTEQQLLKGDLVAAETHAHRQIAMEPWREEGHRQLMRALYQAGQRTVALAQYDRCVTILAEELGIEPSEETTALYNAIRSETLPVPGPQVREQMDLPSNGAQLFICYKRFVQPDSGLAMQLKQALTAKGHDVFIDLSIRSGDAWLSEIDRRIKNADFMVVLLSKDSADSEMVQAEVRRAYDYRRQQGHPVLLPVRLAYEGLLPYTIDAFLSPLQYIIWQGPEDNQLILDEILLAIEGQLPDREPVQLSYMSGPQTLSEDGRMPINENEPPRPLPAFDPRFIDGLMAPGGAVKLSDKFYVERDADIYFKRNFLIPGTISTIRASRQTGKSSLLIRGVAMARQQKAKIISFDLQRLDHEQLADRERFLRYMAETISRQLRLDTGMVEKHWQGLLGSQDKLTYYLEEQVLGESNSHVVLVMDEVDRLLDTGFHNDFFGLVRSWHNSAAYDERWERLSIAMVISTEPYLLIADVNQSPFNVGLKLYLEDFDREQVEELNQRHGSPVEAENISDFMELFGGHPFLTRKALYLNVVEKLSWEELVNTAATDQGPFSDHLRRQFWLLRDEPVLQETLRQIIRTGRSTNDAAIFRLLRAGLINGAGDTYSCRCDLYRRYFKDKL